MGGRHNPTSGGYVSGNSKARLQTSVLRRSSSRPLTSRARSGRNLRMATSGGSTSPRTSGVPETSRRSKKIKENETLFPPYSAFSVKSVSQKACHLEAVDRANDPVWQQFAERTASFAPAARQRISTFSTPSERSENGASRQPSQCSNDISPRAGSGSVIDNAGTCSIAFEDGADSDVGNVYGERGNDHSFVVLTRI